MTHWKWTSMIATTALLGLLGPAVAMKPSGKPTPKKETPPSVSKNTPPASRKSTQEMGRASQEADKKTSSDVKPGEKQGEAAAEATTMGQRPPVKTTAQKTSTSGHATLVEVEEADRAVEKQKSATEEHSETSDQKSESGDAKEYQLPDFKKQWGDQKAARKGNGGDGREAAAAPAAPREPTKAAVKAPTLRIAKAKNLEVAGGKGSFEAMVEQLDEGSLDRGKKRGGSDDQLRLDIQNIAQDFEKAKFINFQIQVNGRSLPNKEHTSLANVILDKRLLEDRPMALQKLKEGLAQSFKEEAKVIVTFNDAEGAAFIKEHSPTKKSSESDEEEVEKDTKGKTGKGGKS